MSSAGRRLLGAGLRRLFRQRQSGKRVLVLQPLPGIGDMVWHIPHLHALAAEQGPLTVLTKPRSQAGELLAADPSVAQLLFLQRPGRHGGIIGSLRLVRELRRHRFASAWLFHGSTRYALLLVLAGIPKLHGYGRGWQRDLLNGVMLTANQLRDHPIDKADVLLQQAGIPRTPEQSALYVNPVEQHWVQQTYGHWPQPWIALGIGSSEARKQWGEQNFAALAASLHEQYGATLFLLGGPAELGLGQAIITRVQQATGYSPLLPAPAIARTAAILQACCLYIGNDTGALNMAAAVEVPCIGLFGGSLPLRHSPLIHALTPLAGEGMAAITPRQVMQAVAACEQRLGPQRQKQQDNPCGQTYSQ